MVDTCVETSVLNVSIYVSLKRSDLCVDHVAQDAAQGHRRQVVPGRVLGARLKKHGLDTFLSQLCTIKCVKCVDYVSDKT